MFGKRPTKKDALLRYLTVLGCLLKINPDLRSAFAQLSIFLNASINESREKDLKEIWQKITEDVSGGESITDCLKRVGGLIDEKDLQNLQQAEADGCLEDALANLDKDFCESGGNLTLSGPIDNNSQVARLFNQTLSEAVEREVPKIVFKTKAPEGDDPKPPSDESNQPEDIDDILSSLQTGISARPPLSVYYFENERWEQTVDIPAQFKTAVFNHIFYLAGIPYWHTNRAEGKIQTKVGERLVRAKCIYSPEKQQILLENIG